MHRIQLAFLILLPVFGCSKKRVLPSREVLTVTVQKDVESGVRALYAGDYAFVIRFTHPVILEGLGGPERALSVVKKSIAPMMERGIQIESLIFPQPPIFVETSSDVFAFVPTLLILKLGEERVESLNFQFGILDADADEWRYVEGSRITPDNVRLLFPSYPGAYKFPDTYRKKL